MNVFEQSLVSYLFETHNQEVNYIRAEMHEEEQRLDREQFEREDAEENERQYREAMRNMEREANQLPKGGVQ